MPLLLKSPVAVKTIAGTNAIKIFFRRLLPYKEMVLLNFLSNLYAIKAAIKVPAPAGKKAQLRIKRPVVSS